MIRIGSTKTQEINLVSLYFPFLLRNYIFRCALMVSTFNVLFFKIIKINSYLFIFNFYDSGIQRIYNKFCGSLDFGF